MIGLTGSRSFEGVVADKLLPPGETPPGVNLPQLVPQQGDAVCRVAQALLHASSSSLKPIGNGDYVRQVASACRITGVMYRVAMFCE